MMRSLASPGTLGAGLAAFAAAVAIGIAIREYATAGSGVDGTAGALLAACGAAGVLVAAALLLLRRNRSESLDTVLLALMLLAIVLTGLAAWLLWSWGVLAAMAAALAGAAVRLAAPRRDAAAAG